MQFESIFVFSRIRPIDYLKRILMSNCRELIQYNGLLFQGYFAYESQEYDEPLPGWSGNWNSQQDKQHEQFRVRQPQQKLAKHNMYAKAAAFSTAFYCEQVRCLLILCIIVLVFSNLPFHIRHSVLESWLLSHKCVSSCIYDQRFSVTPHNFNFPKLIKICSFENSLILENTLELFVAVGRGLFFGCHKADFF